MPLSTQIIRDGEALQLRWDQFHIAAMTVACMFEDEGQFAEALPNDGLDYPSEPQPLGINEIFQIVSYPVLGAVFPTGTYTLQRDHAFLDSRDGEIFTMQAGDVLRLFRN